MERSDRRSLLASAWFGTVVALALLAAGGTLSVFSSELKRAGLLSALDPQRHAIWLSVTAVSIAGFLYVCRQHAVDRERSRSQNEMIRLADELRALVLTMPPRDFIQDFARYYEEAEQLVRRVVLEPDARARGAMIPPTIRCVLRIICQLARRFDDAPRRAEYSANVMVYRRSDDLEPEEQQRLGACLKRLSSDAVGVNALRGVLELRNELSVSCQEDDPEPNSVLPDGLALPLFRGGAYAETLRPGEHTLRFRILPGAPVAFELGTYALVENTLEIQDWCKQHTDLNGDDIARVVDFFSSAEGSMFRSFVSIAIPDLGASTGTVGNGGPPRRASRTSEVVPVIDAAGNLLLAGDSGVEAEPDAGPMIPQPIGVVNVECTVERMLRGSDDRLEQFVNAITPFKLMLARLVADAPAGSGISVQEDGVVLGSGEASP